MTDAETLAHEDEEVNATLEGLLDRLMASYRAPGTELHGNPSALVMSAFCTLLHRLDGMAGLRLVGIIGPQDQANVAINIALSHAAAAGEMVHQFPPALRLSALMLCSQELGKTASGQPPSGEAAR